MSCFREIAPRSFSNSPYCRDSPPIFAVTHAPLPTNRPTKFTIPRHVEPSQRKTFIAPVSSGKTEGEIPSPIAGFQNRTFIVPPLSSSSQSCIGGASRSLCEGFPNLRRHCNEEGDVRTGNDECAHQTSTEKKEKGAEEEGTSGCSHDSSGETKKKRGILPNKWRLSAKNPRLLSVEVGETRSRLAVRRRICNFATT